MSLLRLRTENLHEVAIDGRRLLFHVPTTSLFDLDAVGCDLLGSLREREHVDGAELVAALAGRHGGDAVVEALDEFRRLDLVESEGASRPTRPPPPFPEDGLTSLVLNVTTGCNLGCTYCYKQDLTTAAAAERIEIDTARAAIDLLLAKSGRRHRVNLTFFGGEPLSNLPLIRTAVAYAKQAGMAAGKLVDFSLTTNATLLTEEIVDWLDAHHFGLTVSLDGPQAVHDRNRRTIGGQGTYEVVVAKARMLLGRYASRPVGARVTLTAGITDVVGIHHHLKNELGFAEVGFAPVTAGLPDGFRLNETETRAVFDGLRALALDYRDAAMAGRDIGFSNMAQLLNALHQGTGKLVPCGAGANLLSVDTRGDIHLCHRFVGSDLPTFGSVATGIDRPGLNDFLRRALARAEDFCGHCRARHLCAGGCYHEAWSRHGDPLLPVDHYCDLMRDWVDLGIALYGEISAANSDFFNRHPERGSPST